MNATNRKREDSALDNLLRAWRVVVTLPARFRERVWQRIWCRHLETEKTKHIGTKTLIKPSRARLFYVLGLTLVSALFIFWRPIQRQCLVYFLLRSASPSSEVLSEVVSQKSNPESLLKRLWQTQRLPHRHFVMSYLARTANSTPAVFKALEPIVLGAVRDADIETRELALAALAGAKHPELRELALEQLTDVDPAARVLGLETLRSIATRNDVPIAIRLLTDTEPRVVVAAALVLRQVTGNDFGIRLSHALPQFTGMGTNAPPAPDLNAIGQGVHRWRDWWAQHQAEYPAAQVSRSRGKPVAGLATDDFGLRDSDGKSVHLSDYRGKVVLLTFWSSDSPANPDAALELASLQQANPKSLAVLGICVPPASSCDDEHEPIAEHANHHHHQRHEATSPLNPRADRIPGRPLEHNITYPTLFDSKGAIGLCFAVETLPTYVLIDAHGIIRRRFVGKRDKQVVEAMIHEVMNTEQPRHGGIND